MAPSAIQHNVTIIPGVQGAAGKAISQTNKDIVANRKALRMGGNPQTTAVAENKSAADALRAEMGFGGAAPVAAPTTPTNTAPMSAKAALKRKAAVMDEENENTETDYSAPATPIPKAVSGPVEDVQDTVRYITTLVLLILDYGNRVRRNVTMSRNFTSIIMKISSFDKRDIFFKLNLTLALLSIMSKDFVGYYYTIIKAVPRGPGIFRTISRPLPRIFRISPL
jgi:hypothetical protein